MIGRSGDRVNSRKTDHQITGSSDHLIREGSDSMGKFRKLEKLESRHPGLRRQVEAMFEAFIPLRAISAALQAQYGERISPTAIGTYKREFWNAQRARTQARSAAAGR
jgi:hypothetical protein